MNLDPSRTVVAKHRYAASAERVFDAWLDPAKAKKWLFTTPTGTMVRAEIDARVGGKFNFTRREEDDIEHVGTYLEIDRPRRLVFTFAVPKFSAEETRVTIDIKPLETGCELTLTHEGVLPEWIERVNEGWVRILAGLDKNVDPNSADGILVEAGTIRFERILPGPVERVWEYLTDSEKRGKWFAAGALEPRVGGTIELRFDHASLTSEAAPEKYKELVDQPGPFFKERITRFEPPKVLSWTWDAGADGPSEVTFELSPRGDKVLLVLTHRRLADRHIANVAAGWHSHLAVLVDQLNGRKTEKFWSILADAESEYQKQFGKP